ncbi:MAG TPA: hypothetical protein V6C81_04290 [Planktothrix sp.]|jgi:hypothetical protein
MSSANSTTANSDATNTALDNTTDQSSSDTSNPWRAAARQNQAVVEQSVVNPTAAAALPTAGVDTSTDPLSEQQMIVPDQYSVPQVDITGNHDNVIMNNSASSDDSADNTSVTVNGNHDKVVSNESTNDSSDDSNNNSGSSNSNNNSSVSINGNHDKVVSSNQSSNDGSSYSGTSNNTVSVNGNHDKVSSNNSNDSVSVNGNHDRVVSSNQSSDSSSTDWENTSTANNTVTVNGSHDKVNTDSSNANVAINGNHDKVVSTNQSTTESDDWSGGTTTTTSSDGSSNPINISVNAGSTYDSTSDSNTSATNLAVGDGATASTVNFNVTVPDNNPNDWAGGLAQNNTINLDATNTASSDQNAADNVVNVNISGDSTGNTATNTTNTLNLTGDNQTFNVNMSDDSTQPFNINLTGQNDTVNIVNTNDGTSASGSTSGSSGDWPTTTTTTTAGDGTTTTTTSGGGDTTTTTTSGGGDSWSGGTTTTTTTSSGDGSGDGSDGSSSSSGGYPSAPDYSTNAQMVQAQQDMIAGVNTLAQIQSNSANAQMYTNEADADFSNAEVAIQQAATELGLSPVTESQLLEGDANGNLSADQRLAGYQGDSGNQGYTELEYDGRLASHEEQGDGGIEANGPQGDIFMQTLMNGQNNGQAGVFLDTPQDAQYFLQALTQSIGSDGQINGDFLKQTTADTYYAGTGTDILPILNESQTEEADNSPSTLYRSFPDPTSPTFLSDIANDSGWSTSQTMADALWGHLQTSLPEGTEITNANAASFLANADSPSDFIDQPLIDLSSSTTAAYDTLLDSEDPGDAINAAFLNSIGQSYGINDLAGQAGAYDSAA